MSKADNLLKELNDAVRLNDHETISVVVEQLGAEVRSKPDLLISPGEDGYVPLVKAINSDYDSKTIEYVINQMEDVDVSITKNKSSALMVASDNGKIDIANFLLEKGANLNLTNKFGNTALMHAAAKGKIDVVDFLLKNSADLNLKSGEGSTALVYASREGHQIVVDFLLEKNANINLTNQFGNTALIYAAEKGNLDVVRSLLDKGADPNLQNNEGVTALMYAAEKGNLDVVRSLLDKGADPNLQNNEGVTALMYANKNGHKDVISSLNLVPENKQTQQMSAIQGNNKAKTWVQKITTEESANKNRSR